MLMLDQLVGFKNIFTFSRVCSQACEHTVYLTNLKCNVLCIYRMAHANWAGSVRKKIQKNFRNLKHAIVAKHIADVLIESGALSLEDWETLKHKPLSEPDRMEELLFRIIKYNREHYVSFLRALVHAGKSSIALDLIVDDINWLEVSGSSDPSAPIIDASLNRGRTREALQDNRITQTLNDLSTNFPDTNDQHVTRREAEADPLITGTYLISVILWPAIDRRHFVVASLQMAKYSSLLLRVNINLNLIPNIVTLLSKPVLRSACWKRASDMKYHLLENITH